jgi:site-specific recombinase XerD
MIANLFGTDVVVGTLRQAQGTAEGFGVWLREQGSKEASVVCYEQDVRVFGRWFVQACGQAFDARLLTNVDLRAFRRWCLEVEQCAPSTWNRRRVSLLKLAQWATSQGWIAGDAMRGVDAQEEQRLAPRWLDDGDFHKLLRQAEREINAANTAKRKVAALRDRAMVAVMVYAGLRVGEAASLAMGDVEIGERKGKVVVRMGKREKRREVPLSQEAREAVKEYLHHRLTQIGEITQIDESLFGMGERAMQKRMKELCAAAGLEGVTPHRLRHTCAKRMVDGGIGLQTAAAVLGHTKLETTRRYTEAGWSDLEEAVDQVMLGKTNQRKDGRYG